VQLASKNARVRADAPSPVRTQTLPPMAADVMVV
jgi:hypothetical protein